MPPIPLRQRNGPALASGWRLLPGFESRIDRTPKTFSSLSSKPFNAPDHGRPIWRTIVWLGLIANGLLISGAWWLADVGFRQARTLDRVLACSVLSFTWCLLGLEVLGTLGLLAIGPLVVWMGLLFAVGLVVHWLRPVSPLGPSTDETTAEPWRWETLLALTFVLWALVELGMQSLLLPVKVVSDGRSTIFTSR